MNINTVSWTVQDTSYCHANIILTVCFLSHYLGRLFINSEFKSASLGAVRMNFSPYVEGLQFFLSQVL